VATIPARSSSQHPVDGDAFTFLVLADFLEFAPLSFDTHGENSIKTAQTDGKIMNNIKENYGWENSL